MSDNTSRLDPKTGGKKPLGKLKEALAAYSDREKLLHDDCTCLSLGRLRNLALNSGLTTATEVGHLMNCRRCTVMLRAMQSELGTGAPNASAEDEFPLHGQAEEPERARMLMWRAHEPARALRHHHHSGVHSDGVAFARLIGESIRAQVADPLTPWAQSFDESWSLTGAMTALAAEATRLETDYARVVAEAYAGAVRDAPIPLKAVLIWGLRGLSSRGPKYQQTAQTIALRVADDDRGEARVVVGMLVHTRALRVPSGEPWSSLIEDTRLSVKPFLSNADDEELDAREASTLQKRVIETVKHVIHSHDSLTAVIRLLAARPSLCRALEQARRLRAESVFGHVINILMHSAQPKRGSLFLAIELALQVGSVGSVVQAMTDLLEEEDPRLRHALFVYFVEAMARQAVSDEMPRFVRESGGWIFEGGASHPLEVFGERAARLARRDRSVAALLEWSNDRLAFESNELLAETFSV